MAEHKVGTQEEWQAVRDELLKEEKELTRRGDELTKKRQALPWVPVEKGYSFETSEGTKSLADLFDDRSQLLIYHFMFGPSYQAGCPINSSIADTVEGVVPHLNAHDVTMLFVSQAPIEKLQAYRRRMGWGFPWASSFGGDFNYDFGVAFTEAQQRSGTVKYNFHAMDTRSELTDGQTLAVFGTDAATVTRETPGMSAFALEDGLVYHTYSTYTRGLDPLWGMYQWLDRAPLGRNETMVRGMGDLRGPTWFRRHDEYESE